MRDYDALTDEEAEAILRDLYAQHPEVVAAVEDATLASAPLAGPIRVLREVDSTLAPDHDHGDRWSHAVAYGPCTREVI